MGIGDIGFLQADPLGAFVSGMGSGSDFVRDIQKYNRDNEARQLLSQSTGSALAGVSPEAFKLEQGFLSQQSEANQSEQQRMLMSVARDAKTALGISDPIQRNQFLGSRAQRIVSEGGDPSDTLALIELPFEQQNFELQDAINQIASVEQLTKQESGQSTPSSVRETEWFLRQPPDVQKKHIELKRKSDPTLAQKLEQAKSISDIKVSEEGRKTDVKSQAQRVQGFIDTGVEAADSLSNIARVGELLDSIETGGFDNVSLRAKQLFGIESADEAELSAGLGKAILSQLKPIFGAAFTAAEGERLERIEANFGKSTEGNKRLIQQVRKITERAARRGLRAAKEKGDKFTAEEIQVILDNLKSESKDVLGGQVATNPANELPGDNQVQEGQIIVNPTTGERLRLVNGQYVEVK